MHTSSQKQGRRVDTSRDGGDWREGGEVTGTKHCLIKKGYSLECLPKAFNSKVFNNTISEKAKDSEGKVLDYNAIMMSSLYDVVDLCRQDCVQVSIFLLNIQNRFLLLSILYLLSGYTLHSFSVQEQGM